ncbi:hypothetical protein [Streptomyces atratus]|uniref:hypothetical protein n=1 Tax=Streptomyces atratus TaxID=1893 RepID=UPI0033FEF6FB
MDPIGRLTGIAPLIAELQILHTASNTTWVITATLLVAAVRVPVVGRLGDLIGKRPRLAYAGWMIRRGGTASPRSMTGCARCVPVHQRSCQHVSGTPRGTERPGFAHPTGPAHLGRGSRRTGWRRHR